MISWLIKMIKRMLLTAFTTNVGQKNGKLARHISCNGTSLLLECVLSDQLCPQVGLNHLIVVTFILRAGKTFKGENVDPTPEEKFALLPLFWHGMSSPERRVVMAAIQSHTSKYTPASCLRTLREECNLLLSQMNNVWVCATVSQEHLKSLDFDIHDLMVEDIQGPNVVAAGQVSLVANLYHLTLIPKDDAGNAIIRGIDLFDHMCHFQKLKHAAAKGKGWNNNKMSQMKPSSGLGLLFDNNSINLIQPTLYDLRHGAIVKDNICNNAACKNARRKMDSIGYLVGHCGLFISEENQRMREQLTMADSVAEINQLEAEDKELE
jgi:hypothetical protein